MDRQREMREPVHGFIQRHEQEEKLIDTSIFQRLRGIRQLAMAHLVYPGAVHTRFGHSIGVMHIAGRLAERLLNDQDSIRTVRLAALLHDVGHGPFSHVSEEVLDRFYDHDKVKPKSKEKIHEHLTCQIIEKSPEIAQFTSPDERRKITNLLLGHGTESIIRGIISGPLDADKQDYLLRDSYFCGVRYGIFDLERLIGSLQCHQDRFDKLLAVDRDGVYVIEQFVLAKYHMTTQVYRHRIRLITDAMIVRALELGLEIDHLDWLEKLYRYDGSDDYIRNYLEWDDQRLSTSLLYPMHAAGLATELFRRLRDRNLFKRVFSKPLREIPEADVRDVVSGLRKRPEIRKKIEKGIADYLSFCSGDTIKADHVIVATFSIKSAREQSRNEEGPIIVISDDGSPKHFEEESTLFRSIDERENDQYLEVYAPFSFDGVVDKRRRMAEFSEKIHEVILQATMEELAQEDGEDDEIRP